MSENANLSLRETIKQRDGISDEAFDELLEEFVDLLDDGEDPEEALAQVFEIEPDFLIDAEIVEAIAG